MSRLSLIARAIAGAAFAFAVLALTPSVASAYIYWLHGLNDDDGGAIGRANSDGSGVVGSFVPTGVHPKAIAIDAHHIYWTNASYYLGTDVEGSIGRANLDGSDVDQSFIPGINPKGVAVDGKHIYWAEQPGKIGRADLDGTHVDPNFIIVGPSPFPFSTRNIAVDSSHLYWTDSTDLGPVSEINSIDRANLDGTDVKVGFIDDLNRPGALAIDSDHIYWTNIGSRANDYLPFGIGRANLDGTGVDRSFTLENANGVAVDARHLYWTAFDPISDATTIVRANLDGSSAQQNFIALRGDAGAIAVGPQGPPGRDAKVTCTVRKKGKSKDEIKVTCKVRLVSATSARVHWKLTRKGRIVAGGVARTRNGHFKLHLSKIEKLRKGRYVLHIAGRKGGTAFAVR